ncbi:MAG TPA: hypothetical protein VIO32_10705 [Candidatus Baltobacteraceae bacterium]
MPAFLYVGALWYSAPLFFKAFPGVADRLRAVLAIGVALAGALSLVHLLYPALLWLALGTLCILRAFRRPHPCAPDLGLSITLAAAVLICWPSLVRPPLDGDSLLYHLPNALAFAQDHSLWVHRAPYWLYPAASELFAAGLFDASGQWSLPLAGVLPALLIAARLYSVARNAQAPPYAAGTVALAFTFMPVAAFETGTLQNDLWLAAFLVEIVSAADRSPVSFALCALLKPFGWIEALIAAVAARLSLRSVLLGLVPFTVWLVRDAVLLARNANVGFSAPAYMPSTIAGNCFIAVAQLAHGIATVTPQAFVWLALLAAGACFAPARRYAFAGIAVLALYAFLPLAYKSGSINYVLDASSLRFALPALACGALAAATFAARVPRVAGVAAAFVALRGAVDVFLVFWNDAYTHWAPAAAAVCIVAVLAIARTRSVSIAVCALAVILAGGWGASSRAAGFYSEWMRGTSGKPTGVFTWLAAHKPRAVVAENVRTGAVLVMSPGTRAFALPFAGCDEARTMHALLLVGNNEDLVGAALARAMRDARRCGRTLYEDSAALIVEPRS